MSNLGGSHPKGALKINATQAPTEQRRADRDSFLQRLRQCRERAVWDSLRKKVGGNTIDICDAQGLPLFSSDHDHHTWCMKNCQGQNDQLGIVCGIFDLPKKGVCESHSFHHNFHSFDAVEVQVLSSLGPELAKAGRGGMTGLDLQYHTSTQPMSNLLTFGGFLYLVGEISSLSSYLSKNHQNTPASPRISLMSWWLRDLLTRVIEREVGRWVGG